MTTECNQECFEFHPLNERRVVGRFDGGTITTDAGGLLLREVEKRTGIMARFAGCFRDHRAAEQVEHTVQELVAQRVYALALGYEDLNDHDELRRAPRLGGACRGAGTAGGRRAGGPALGAGLAGPDKHARAGGAAAGGGGTGR